MAKKKGKKKSNLPEDSPLHAIAEMWGDENATTKTGTSELPDGTYMMQIREGDDGGILFAKDKNDNPYASWRMVVVECETGDLVGRKYSKFDGLVTPENLGWFKGSISKLGLDVPEEMDAEDLRDLAGEVRGIYCEVQLKTGEAGFQNCYINGAAEDYEPPA